MLTFERKYVEWQWQCEVHSRNKIVLSKSNVTYAEQKTYINPENENQPKGDGFVTRADLVRDEDLPARDGF